MKERLLQLRQVLGALQVERCGPASVGCHQLAGQRCLADLSGSDDGDDGELPQQIPERSKVPGALDHGRHFAVIIGYLSPKCHGWLIASSAVVHGPPAVFCCEHEQAIQRAAAATEQAAGRATAASAEA